MKWHHKNYKITVKDGSTRNYNGHCNGLFAHNFACVLTHLKSGLQIAQFNREEPARRVGDYLSEKYGGEFRAFEAAIKKGMNFEQMLHLPETTDLMNKLRADGHLKQQIAEFGYLREEKNDTDTDEKNTDH